jgi:hypothetical protein
VELIERAFRNAGIDQDPLRVELWFYLLAVGPIARRHEALAELAALLGAGVRSPGWDFSRLLARAREEEHLDIEWLERLASVISDGADLETLEEWEQWPQVTQAS